MVTHDRSAAEHAHAHRSIWRRACSSKARSARALGPLMQFLQLIAAQRVAPQAAHALTVLGIVVAVSAFGLLRRRRRLVRRRERQLVARRLVTRNAISLVFPLPLHYRRRSAQVPGVKRWRARTGSAASTSDRRTSSRSSRSTARSISRCIPSTASPSEREGVSARPRAARSSAASSPTSTAGRSATRCRCAARSSRATGASRCAASTTAPRRAPTRRSSSSIGTT